MVDEHSNSAIRANTLIGASDRVPDPLSIAIRVYPEGRNFEPRKPPPPRPNAMLVFDTETRVDAAQRLTFGSYRFIVSGDCLEEGLFYGDDLPTQDRKVLEDYVSKHKADTIYGISSLRLLSRSQFVDRLFLAAYKGRCLLIAFSFPFDISRVASDFTDARDRFVGGFSLGLWSYSDPEGHESRDKYRPRVAIKQIDSKRALKAFTGRKKPDRVDLIPEGSRSGRPTKEYVFHGHFLDVRTLAFALTDKGYTLESACEDFGVEHRKKRAERHGEVTEEYIDYNRRDVLATSELTAKLLEEYDKHPIALQATKAYSPASIGKSYLRAMGIRPIFERQPNFPKAYLGYAQSAFFGGRASGHIRKIAVPVVYCDFLSMYPTVNSLMGLWDFVTAREIRVIENCADEIRAFLKRLEVVDLFNPRTWQYLQAFVRVIPNGDILPSRAKYSLESNDWQVAVNHIYARNDDPNDALWFSLPDVVVSRLLTGRTPKIIEAFRIAADPKLSELNGTKLRNAISIDPKEQDFFRVAIEERKRLSSRTDLPENERTRLDKALKVLANAASYGIYAEMNRQESDREVNVNCHGIDPEPFTCRVAHPDVPGEFCFPPLASLITGAARLTLALLEISVRELGGTYAMEDTDSMAIVATEHGGVIPSVDGHEVIHALSWEQIRQISQRFDALNPYNREAIPGSILKIEDDNFDPKNGNQRQLYCLAISAKRYALFLKNEDGEPILLRNGVNNKEDRWSEHGLGHLLNPTDPESEDREWIAQAWTNIIRRALDLPTENLGFENLPAVGRVTISSPAVMRPLANLNEGKRYPDQIKPYNFLKTCHVRPFGYPPDVDPQRFHLIAPYEADSRQWLKTDWIDQYTGKSHRITTEGHHDRRGAVRVKTYGDVLLEYEFHAESKCADAQGKRCGKQTIGLLQRRHIRIDQLKYIGKESNSLEEVEAGLIHSAQNVYTEYPDPKRDEWETKIRPAMNKVPLSLLVKEIPRSRRMLMKARAGYTRPHPKNQELIVAALRRLGGI